MRTFSNKDTEDYLNCEWKGNNMTEIRILVKKTKKGNFGVAIQDNQPTVLYDFTTIVIIIYQW